MPDKDIIEFLKVNGPTTPAQLAKQLETSLLFASAMLGEIASKGLIKISNLKIGGGSPLYYLKDQEEQLQNFSDRLNAKDRQAFELIKNKRILRDREQTPIIRISLRTIRDFAIPLKIKINNQEEIFWKWYLLDNKEAEIEIRKSVTPTKKSISEKPKEIPKAEPTKLEKPRVMEIQKKIGEDSFDLNEEFFLKNTGPLAKKLKLYFDEKNIDITNYEIVKKNKEFELSILVPSSIGKSKFYCKILDKKKIGLGDIALALVEGRYRNLPVLFFTTGEIPKKQQDKVDLLFKDVNFIKI